MVAAKPLPLPCAVLGCPSHANRRCKQIPDGSAASVPHCKSHCKLLGGCSLSEHTLSQEESIAHAKRISASPPASQRRLPLASIQNELQEARQPRYYQEVEKTSPPPRRTVHDEREADRRGLQSIRTSVLVYYYQSLGQPDARKPTPREMQAEVGTGAQGRLFHLSSEVANELGITSKTVCYYSTVIDWIEVSIGNTIDLRSNGLELRNGPVVILRDIEVDTCEGLDDILQKSDPAATSSTHPTASSSSCAVNLNKPPSFSQRRKAVQKEVDEEEIKEIQRITSRSPPPYSTQAPGSSRAWTPAQSSKRSRVKAETPPSEERQKKKGKGRRRSTPTPPLGPRYTASPSPARDRIAVHWSTDIKQEEKDACLTTPSRCSVSRLPGSPGFIISSDIKQEEKDALPTTPSHSVSRLPGSPGSIISISSDSTSSHSPLSPPSPSSSAPRPAADTWPLCASFQDVDAFYRSVHHNQITGDLNIFRHMGIWWPDLEKYPRTSFFTHRNHWQDAGHTLREELRGVTDETDPRFWWAYLMQESKDRQQKKRAARQKLSRYHARIRRQAQAPCTSPPNSSSRPTRSSGSGSKKHSHPSGSKSRSHPSGPKSRSHQVKVEEEDFTAVVKKEVDDNYLFDDSENSFENHPSQHKAGSKGKHGHRRRA
ncbi:hypothetical protein VNI00_016437 [Paramarasmius palmivorus]|uniref:Uncharacterized protein n=1 Tax=Paramarasmius palmivorus TaxID=297713 RepID=A0AAW0BDP4_9AGAR